MYEENHQLPHLYPHCCSHSSDSDNRSELRSLLIGNSCYGYELPELVDLLSAVISLALGARHKVILPLGRTPAEFAFVRSGDRIRIDLYGTESITEVFVRDREIPLRQLMDTCIAEVRAIAQAQTNTATSQAMHSIALRASQTKILPDPHRGLQAVPVMGGVVDDPGDQIPLAFGFRASIVPSVDVLHTAHSFADVQALLFSGDLWVYSRGRRFGLMQGPIMLAIQRMVSAVRALIDAWQVDRDLNIRLCSEGFLVGVRYSCRGKVSLALGRKESDSIVLPVLDVKDTIFPILRLVLDLTRTLISIDRIQARNLRISSLRNDVRSLRRMVANYDRLDGFENRDPERLRLTLTDPCKPSDVKFSYLRAPKGRLRYTERWSVEIDALDANSTFLCGDRLIIATSKFVLALCRNLGQILWSYPSNRATHFLTGKVLLRLLEDGELELCDLDDGSAYARNRITPSLSGPLMVFFAGGGNAPPVAILAEGQRRLFAVDLRTGEPRWRYKSSGFCSYRLRRAGGILLLASSNGSIDALEIASGEVLWRFTDRARFHFSPQVVHNTVVACSGEPSGNSSVLYGIDIYTGRLLWRNKLQSGITNGLIEAGNVVVVPIRHLHSSMLIAFDSADGKQIWMSKDPGVCGSSSSLQLDGSLIVNSPSGQVCSIRTATGEVDWRRVLSDPLVDDVPRQLEPILRHGALFVPSARVHILRPSDGESLVMGMDCDLVPDYLRVDERGWFYIAEESGHLRAYAPAIHLSLVR